MRLHLDLSTIPPQLSLTDPEDCTALSLEVLESDHAFITPEVLRELATESQRSPDWEDRFAKMIAYADSRGWVRAEDSAIRVHIE